MSNPNDISIRAAVAADLTELERIYAAARRFMRSHNNFAQWSESYPSATSARADMARGWCFVVEYGGRLTATFCLMTDSEPTYSALYQALTVPYVTLHRVASDGTVGGILAAAVRFAMSRHHCDIRIDTHADNADMRRAIGRLGFEPTGTISLADGSPRLSYRLKADIK